MQKFKDLFDHIGIDSMDNSTMPDICLTDALKDSQFFNWDIEKVSKLLIKSEIISIKTASKILKGFYASNGNNALKLIPFIDCGEIGVGVIKLIEPFSSIPLFREIIACVANQSKLQEELFEQEIEYKSHFNYDLELEYRLALKSLCNNEIEKSDANKYDFDEFGVGHYKTEKTDYEQIQELFNKVDPVQTPKETPKRGFLSKIINILNTSSENPPKPSIDPLDKPSYIFVEKKKKKPKRIKIPITDLNEKEPVKIEVKVKGKNGNSPENDEIEEAWKAIENDTPEIPQSDNYSEPLTEINHQHDPSDEEYLNDQY